MPGTEKGYLENWATEKSRLSSYTFPRAVEIGRRLLPIFPHLAFRETFQTWKHLFTEPPSRDILQIRFCVLLSLPLACVYVSGAHPS
jgi:hypothetical protein